MVRVRHGPFFPFPLPFLSFFFSLPFPSPSPFSFPFSFLFPFLYLSFSFPFVFLSLPVFFPFPFPFLFLSLSYSFFSLPLLFLFLFPFLAHVNPLVKVWSQRLQKQVKNDKRKNNIHSIYIPFTCHMHSIYIPYKFHIHSLLQVVLGKRTALQLAAENGHVAVSGKLSEFRCTGAVAQHVGIGKHPTLVCKSVNTYIRMYYVHMYIYILFYLDICRYLSRYYTVGRIWNENDSYSISGPLKR